VFNHDPAQYMNPRASLSRSTRSLVEPTYRDLSN